MTKKKLVSLCLVLALVLTAVIGGTMAYFTDTDSATNTFTSGNVNIDLTEADTVKDNDGNLIKDPDESRHDVEGSDATDSVYDYGNLYPGQSVFKDPTITNTGTENAYVAAIVTVTADPANEVKLADEKVLLNPSKYMDLLRIDYMISGGFAQPNQPMKKDHPLCDTLPVYGTDEYSVYQVPNKEDNVYTFYFFVENVLEPTKEVTLFNTMTVPATWDNYEMSALKGLNIQIDAYAVQEYGFHDCFTAMKTAFPEVFDF